MHNQPSKSHKHHCNEKNDDDSTCCLPFNPDPWDDKMLEWNDKLFIRKKVKMFFFMPLNFGSVMSNVIPKCAKKYGKNYVVIIAEVN